MTVDQVLGELRRSGEPLRVAALKRSGAASPAFGVGLPALRTMAKRIGHDHHLAEALWATGVREARILASLIDERERVTRSQMDRWAVTFDSWEICNQCCQNLFADTAFALDKAVEWTRRTEEFVKRAAFVLVAVRAVHDKGADDRAFADLLPTLVAAADDQRLYVRKGASWALRQVGKRSDRLQTRVLAAVDPYIDADGRGIRWVARDVSRELGSRPSGRAGGYLRRRSSRAEGRFDEEGDRMRVGVIGSGRNGGNVGTQLARAGHEVMFSFTRDRAALDEFAGGVRGASAGSPSEAAEFADAVILAVPWSLVERAVEEAGGLAGKTVVDTTNQYGGGGLESLPEGLTAAEVNARRMPDARLAKAFNTLTSTYQRDVAEGRIEGPVAMFYASEDAAAAEAAEELVSGCGFEPVRIGGWAAVRLMEAPRRDGAVYGEAYRPDDARRIAETAGTDLDRAAALATELRLPD